MASKLYGNNGSGDKKKKRKELKPLDKVARKSISMSPKKKALAKPKAKVAKVTFTDNAGKKHSTKLALIKANRKLKGNTQVGDYNPRTGKKQD